MRVLPKHVLKINFDNASDKLEVAYEVFHSNVTLKRTTCSVSVVYKLCLLMFIR